MDLNFKQLQNVRLTSKKSKYSARWYSIKGKHASKITIFLCNSAYNDCDGKIDYEEVILYINFFILSEYLCSCIMRGNGMKKQCKDTKKIRDGLKNGTLQVLYNPELLVCIPEKICRWMMNIE